MSVTDRRPVITLLTDYGTADEFVGVLHGVIARICPQAHVIDLSHGVPPQDIRAGAARLLHALPYMPPGVHVAIVDPTVGGERRALVLRLGDGRLLVGPDNGLLWPATEACGGVAQALEISASPWRLQPVSATFHGRDIFAPVAAHLAAGEPLERAGDPLDPSVLVRLEAAPVSSDGGMLVATVVGVDGFGNVQLGATAEQLDAVIGDVLTVDADSGESLPGILGRSFADVEAGQLVVLEDSSQQLALALNRGSAASRLGLAPGSQVRISTPREA